MIENLEFHLFQVLVGMLDGLSEQKYAVISMEVQSVSESF